MFTLRDWSLGLLIRLSDWMWRESRYTDNHRTYSCEDSICAGSIFVRGRYLCPVLSIAMRYQHTRAARESGCACYGHKQRVNYSSKYRKPLCCFLGVQETWKPRIKLFLMVTVFVQVLCVLGSAYREWTSMQSLHWHKWYAVLKLPKRGGVGLLIIRDEGEPKIVGA